MAELELVPFKCIWIDLGHKICSFCYVDPEKIKHLQGAWAKKLGSLHEYSFQLLGELHHSEGQKELVHSTSITKTSSASSASWSLTFF